MNPFFYLKTLIFSLLIVCFALLSFLNASSHVFFSIFRFKIIILILYPVQESPGHVLRPGIVSVVKVTVDDHARVLGDVNQFAHARVRPMGIQQAPRGAPSVEEDAQSHGLGGLWQVDGVGERGAEGEASPRRVAHRATLP